MSCLSSLTGGSDRRSLTRRCWLGQAAAATAVGYWSFPTRYVSASPSNRLNLGFIGVANRGHTNIAELQTERVAALCDVDSRFLDELGRRHADARRYVDFREMLEQPDLNAVVISTPDHTHFHAAMLAMRRGLHVYCEKPLAHSINEAWQLATAAHRQGVVTQTGNQHHATDGYRQAVEWLRTGAIGMVREVHAWTNRPIWPQGIDRPADMPPVPPHLNWDLWLGPAPQRPYNGIYHPGGWRGWFDFGCGALGDMGPHLLDPVLSGLDLGAPASVWAETWGMTDESFPTASRVYFEFEGRGPHPPMKLTWYDGDRLPPESITGIKQPPDNGVLLLGEKAKLFVPDYGKRPIVLPLQPGQRVELPAIALPLAPTHHQEWIAACKGEGQVSCDFTYGARLTEICLVGNLAVRASRQRPGEQLLWDHARRQMTNAPELSPLVQRAYRAGWELPAAAP